MSQDKVPVLVYEGEYSVALVMRSLLEAEGIAVTFDDLPVGGAWGRRESRIYVARADETFARRVIAVSEKAGD